MAITVNQDELTIINSMLAGLGDLPVEDLEEAASDADVLKARQHLKQIMISEQTLGWWFNTETWEFTPDGTTGYIDLPDNTIRIKGQEQYIIRGGFLYDVTNHTLVIDEDTIDLNLVLLLDYDEVPYSFFQYIQAKARYSFFLQEDGDPQQTQLLAREYSETLRVIQDENIQFKSPNAFTKNPTVQRVFSGWTSRR
jgi:hypothetical protein